MYTLLLKLAAPLQSWGYNSCFDTRDTNYFPTKSGLVGLIAAAKGLKRDESLDDLTALNYGIRIDHQGQRLTDLQIAELEGKLANNRSYRVYLSDAIFLAGIESTSLEELKDIEYALKNPVFALFLGRRSCPPACPIVLGIREYDLYQALYQEEWLLPEWRRKKEFQYHDKVTLRIFIDTKTETTSTALMKDNPKSFSPFKREYGYRMIAEMNGKTVMKQPVSTLTEHDPMKELGDTLCI